MRLSNSMSSAKLAKRGALAISAALSFTYAGTASAQTAPTVSTADFSLVRFDPSPAGDHLFNVPSAFTPGMHGLPADFGLRLMLLGDYAHNPLILETTSGESVGAIVSDQFLLHANITLAAFDRIHLNVDAPLVVQGGDDPTVNGTSFQSPSGATAGDVRLGLRARIYGDYSDPFQAAIAGYMWLPSGGSLASDGSVRGWPHAIISGELATRFIYSAAFGPEMRDTTQFVGIEEGSRFTGAAGVAVLLTDDRSLQIGPEFVTSINLKNADTRSSNSELLLGGKWRFMDHMVAGAGAGLGLVRGIGTPDVRAVFSLTYTPAPASDTDGDGIPDSSDACPTVAGIATDNPQTHGCPDSDGDGIVDTLDACPAEKGLSSEDPAQHGCPDTDGDGIIDKLDACVQEPGAPNADPQKNGCPDRDGDGVLDKSDACPDAPGMVTSDPKTNGCADTDGDGIYDNVDACPAVKGLTSTDPAKHGCPAGDRDGDGVADDVDACPDLAGIKTADPATTGCPGDTDGDGFRDDKDACPTEKGPDNEDPNKRGCPIKKVLNMNLEGVLFDTSKATLRPESNAALDRVAKILNENEQFKLLEVQGHTDNVGTIPANQLLSTQRALAVKQALIRRGVKANRLTSKGYGQKDPIADNGTDAGRQKNRRVVFEILEQE